MRRPAISCTVATTFAYSPGYRKVTGLTSVPSVMREVSREIPARTLHASLVA